MKCQNLFAGKLTLGILDKVFSIRHIKIFFSIFPETLGTICMKCQNLFSGKNIITMSAKLA